MQVKVDVPPRGSHLKKVITTLILNTIKPCLLRSNLVCVIFLACLFYKLVVWSSAFVKVETFLPKNYSPG